MVELAKQLADHNHYVMKNLDMWTFMYLGENGQMQYADDSWPTYEAAAEAAYLHSTPGQNDPGCEWSVYARLDFGWGWQYHKIPDTVRARNKEEALKKADVAATEYMPILLKAKQYEVHAVPTVLGE